MTVERSGLVKEFVPSAPRSVLDQLTEAVVAVRLLMLLAPVVKAAELTLFSPKIVTSGSSSVEAVGMTVRVALLIVAPCAGPAAGLLPLFGAKRTPAHLAVESSELTVEVETICAVPLVSWPSSADACGLNVATATPRCN